MCALSHSPIYTCCLCVLCHIHQYRTAACVCSVTFTNTELLLVCALSHSPIYTCCLCVLCHIRQYRTAACVCSVTFTNTELLLVCALSHSPIQTCCGWVLCHIHQYRPAAGGCSASPEVSLHPAHVGRHLEARHNCRGARPKRQPVEKPAVRP